MASFQILDPGGSTARKFCESVNHALGRELVRGEGIISIGVRRAHQEDPKRPIILLYKVHRSELHTYDYHPRKKVWVIAPMFKEAMHQYFEHVYAQEERARRQTMSGDQLERMQSILRDFEEDLGSVHRHEEPSHGTLVSLKRAHGEF